MAAAGMTTAWMTWIFCPDDSCLNDSWLDKLFSDGFLVEN
jgi:hypothetical protein